MMVWTWTVWILDGTDFAWYGLRVVRTMDGTDLIGTDLDGTAFGWYGLVMMIIITD